MARLDPHAFPDRFALDRYARQMRADEMARVATAALGGLRAIAHVLMGGARRTVAAGACPQASARAGLRPVDLVTLGKVD